MDTKILDQLQKDLMLARQVKTKSDKYISRMRDLYEGRNFKPNQRGSNYVSRDVFKYVEIAKAQYKSPFISNDNIVRITPYGASDRELANQSEKLINYFFKENRYNFLTDMLTRLLVEGTVIIRVGWEYEGREQEVEEPVVEHTIDGKPIVKGLLNYVKEVPIVNRPTAIVCKTEDIYFDPTATSSDNLQFLIHRKAVTLDELKRAGIYKNLDKVHDEYDNEVNYVDQYAMVDNYNFQLSNLEDRERKKIYMYEYWGYYDINNDGMLEPIVASWIGNTLIRFEENPYPDKKIPYIVAQFIKEPDSIHGKALAEILEDKQNLRTGILRGIFDNIKRSNYNQVGVLKGMLDPVNMQRFLNGENYEYNIANAIGFRESQYNRIPSEVFGMLQMIDTEAQLESGVMPIQGGQGTQAIYGSQASKLGQANNLMLREEDVIFNISDNIIKPLVHKWLMMIYEFMTPEEIKEITELPYVKPNNTISYLFRKDLVIDISTKHTDDVKASELSFLLQTLGQSMPQEMTMKLMEQIAKLHNIPDLVNAIQNYKPQPDPYTEEMKKLQLQLLQAQIQEHMAKAKAYGADSQYKATKAKEADAKATNINIDSINKKYGGLDGLTNNSPQFGQPMMKGDLDVNKPSNKAENNEVMPIFDNLK